MLARLGIVDGVAAAAATDQRHRAAFGAAEAEDVVDAGPLPAARQPHGARLEARGAQDLVERRLQLRLRLADGGGRPRAHAEPLAQQVHRREEGAVGGLLHLHRGFGTDHAAEFADHAAGVRGELGGAAAAAQPLVHAIERERDPRDRGECGLRLQHRRGQLVAAVELTAGERHQAQILEAAHPGAGRERDDREAAAADAMQIEQRALALADAAPREAVRAIDDMAGADHHVVGIGHVARRARGEQARAAADPPLDPLVRAGGRLGIVDRFLAREQRGERDGRGLPARIDDRLEAERGIGIG